MLACFVGAPISGKTTCAARLFADLKEQGIAVEMLTEYARFYIARKRYFERDSFDGLNDIDQASILEEQAKHEAVLSWDPSSIVIADSSAISALLYMTDEFISESAKFIPTCGVPNLIDTAKECAKRYDVVFRCAPIRPGVNYGANDHNRIHSFEQSVEIDKRIDFVFDTVGLDLSKVHQLFGDPKFRVAEASSIVMRAVVENLKKAM
jgi:nicotinamide riboside kinase